jgi:Tol biopolymer transport system component
VKRFLFCILALWAPSVPAAAQTNTGVTTRISVTPSHIGAANAVGSAPSISADGRYVAFTSSFSGFVSGDTNANWDVFVRDQQSGTTTRISVTAAGGQVKGSSGHPSISADGRFVAFTSSASGLVSLDTNATSDAFVHDRQTGRPSRVSVSTLGRQANSYSVTPAISADGRFVAFQSHASNLVVGDTNGVPDIFVRDLQTQETSRVSVTNLGKQANSSSAFPSISSDGRFVAFLSNASNLVSGDTNAINDVFVRDRVSGQTTRVSVSSTGSQTNQFSWAPAISANGLVVAFPSLASNLVPGDTNANWDVFVHDRSNAQTSRVNVSTSGGQAAYYGPGSLADRGSPSLSGDGRYVVFVSAARNLVPVDANGFPDLFVRDRLAGTTTLLLRASVDDRSFDPAMTPDGRMVAFASPGTTFPGWRDGYRGGVFVHDRLAGTDRASVSTGGAQATGASDTPSIDGSGRYVVFASAAANLVADDTNNLGDIFLRDRLAGATTRVSLAAGGAELNHGSSSPAISGNGLVVVFRSEASNAVPGDTNGLSDIFVRDLVSGTVTRVSVSTSGTQANGLSYAPAVNHDGRFIAFVSTATNLVPNDSNVAYDVFVHDRQTGETSRVSVADDGAQANSNSLDPALSGDGRFVVFSSLANNLLPGGVTGIIGIFVRDRQAGRTSREDIATDGTRGPGSSGQPAISADGRHVAFGSNVALVAGDTNSSWDVYTRDRQTGATTRISVGAGGTQADLGSSFPSLSADGRYVGFDSDATNLIADDTNNRMDVFVHDRTTGETRRISTATDSLGALVPLQTQGTGGDSRSPRLGASGRVVAFSSDAVGLVRSDTNGAMDVFVNDRGPW